MTTTRVRRLAAGILLFALSQIAGAQDAPRPQLFGIPGHGSLALNIPAGWRVQSQSLANPPSVVLQLVPASGNAFGIQITSIWIDPARGVTPTPESVRARAQKVASELLSKAVEKEIVVADLRGKDAFGAYFTLTGRDAPDGIGEYRYVTQGTVVTGELITVFTVLQRESVPADREQALRLFAEASHSKTEATAAQSSAIQITERNQRIELTVEQSKLVMSVPKGGLVRAQNPFGGSADSPRYFYLVDVGSGLSISGWFEPSQRFRGAAQVWEEDSKAAAKRGFEPQDAVFSKVGDWEVATYETQNPVGNHSHVRAHLSKAGTWIDVHASIVGSSPPAELRSRLAALMNAIEVREKN